MCKILTAALLSIALGLGLLSNDFGSASSVSAGEKTKERSSVEFVSATWTGADLGTINTITAFAQQEVGEPLGALTWFARFGEVVECSPGVPGFVGVAEDGFGSAVLDVGSKRGTATGTLTVAVTQVDDCLGTSTLLSTYVFTPNVTVTGDGSTFSNKSSGCFVAPEGTFCSSSFTRSVFGPATFFEGSVIGAGEFGTSKSKFTFTPS